jgi:hypothetical protein
LEAAKTGILFGNFVFVGLRYISGITKQGEVDLYLQAEDGRQHLTDYNCSFVLQNGTLCSVNSGLVWRPVCRPPWTISFG